VYFEFANLLVFSVVAVGFVIMNLALAWLLRPKSTNEPGKLAIYECGEPTVGQAWVRFDIRFYTVALMFVVFDVEVALLFPWGAIYRDLVASGMAGLALLEAGAFILVLLVGLAYVWARGDIDWTRTSRVRSRLDRPDDLRNAVLIGGAHSGRGAPAEAALAAGGAAKGGDGIDG
jgi:NADH-quinone oxidoreductase subunit A